MFADQKIHLKIKGERDRWPAKAIDLLRYYVSYVCICLPSFLGAGLHLSESHRRKVTVFFSLRLPLMALAFIFIVIRIRPPISPTCTCQTPSVTHTVVGGE